MPLPSTKHQNPKPRETPSPKSQEGPGIWRLGFGIWCFFGPGGIGHHQGMRRYFLTAGHFEGLSKDVRPSGNAGFRSHRQRAMESGSQTRLSRHQTGPGQNPDPLRQIAMLHCWSFRRCQHASRAVFGRLEDGKRFASPLLFHCNSLRLAARRNRGHCNHARLA